MAVYGMLRRPAGVLAAASIAAVPAVSSSRGAEDDSNSRVGRGAPLVFTMGSSKMSRGYWWAGTPVECKSSLIEEQSFTQLMNENFKNIAFARILSDSELMQGTEPVFIKSLCEKAGKKRCARKGDLLIDQGEVNENLYVIGEGTVGIEINGDRVAKVQKGHIVGESAAFEAQTAKASVRVLSDTVYLLEIGHDEFKAALKENPESETVFRKMASKRSMQNVTFEFMQSVSVFSGCSKALIEALVKKLQTVEFEEGTQLVTMGESDNKGMYIIKSGEVGVYDSKGLVTTLGPGEFCGETMLMGGPGKKRGATVRAHGKCECFQLSRGEFLKMATQFPKDFEEMKEISKDRSKELLAGKTNVRKS